jgi:hypothetical protein
MGGNGGGYAVTWDQHYERYRESERRIAPNCGPVRTPLKVSIYRDPECTDLAMVVDLLAGADTLTVDAGCTLRFNEVGE